MRAGSLRHAALSGVRWTLVSRVGLQLVTWPITIVVMRLLEPADYGLFAIALVVSGFIALFSELGLGVALVQATAVTESQARMASTLLLLLNGAIAALIFLAAPWVATLYEKPELALVMRVLTLDLLVSALATVPVAMLQRGLRFRAVSMGQLAGGVGNAAITLLAAWLGAGVWALVVGTLAGSLIRSAVWIGCHGRLIGPGRVCLAETRPMMMVSGHVLAARALWYWSGQADQLILGRLLPAGPLGLYAVASQLAMLPVSKVMEAVNRVALPILSRVDGDARGAQGTHLRVTGILALYGFGVCWGLAAVAPEFVRVVLGEKWRDAAMPLAVLALVAPLRMFCAFHNTVVTAIGRPAAATRELVFASLLMPAAVALGAAWDALYGVALAWMVAYPAVYLASVALTARAIDLGRRAALRPMVGPLLAGLAMLGAICTFRQLLGTQVGLAWCLGIEILTGALVYLIALRLFAHGALLDAQALASDILRPAPEASS